MYAIVKSGSHQYRVAEGQTVDVQRLAAEEGDRVELDVLLIGGNGATKVGQPVIESASVSATVVGEIKGAKVLVQRFKPKSRYKRVRGHRQRFTRLKIDQITTGD